MGAPASHGPTFAARAAVLGLAACALAGAVGPRDGATRAGTPKRADPEPRGPYRLLDNVEGPWIHLNVVAVRPLAAVPGSDAFLALNTHDSTVERFDPALPDPVAVYPVPWGPTAIAYWDRPDPEGDELLVVCRGSYAFVRLDAQTGDVLDVLELRAPDGAIQAEPGDLLLDAARERAFVSCSASDSVVQIDLSSGTIERVYAATRGDDFRCKNPLFLSPGPDGSVFVAPLLSGNDTTAEVTPSSGNGDDCCRALVLDLSAYDPSLPDEDLFRIEPDAPPTGGGPPGRVLPVARATGTILFAHGTNPLTGELWQLANESLNADPERQTEAEIAGEFVENRLVLTTPSDPPVRAHVVRDLDVLAAGDPARTLGQPYALAFRGAAGPDQGVGLVAGLLTDNLVALSADGSAVVGAWTLEPGAIPRGVLLDADESHAYVHCWGTNRVARVDLAAPGAPPTYYDLRHDPTPERVRRGRELFYDGHDSLHGNLSCASCHVEGRSDLLAWNLSDAPGDDKGPMLTQTLAGLERLAPFHWRGERRLVDFNPAFEALLGGVPLDTSPGGDFEAFEAFLFSIRNPANPYQSRDRVLDDRIPTPGALSPTTSAVRGQVLFDDEASFRTIGGGIGFRCSDCHALPTGTINDTFVESAVNTPRRAARKVAPFHELWRRVQPAVSAQVTSGGETEELALLGSGFNHAGRFKDVRTFVAQLDITDTVQTEDDLAAFVHQFDSGLAPAVHRALFLDASSPPEALAEIRDHLVRQADLRNCDVVAFGRFPVGATLTALRWSYDRASGRFVPESTGLPTVELEAFAAATRSGAANAFIGLPVGMGERFGIDYDFDGKRNLDEPGSEYVADAPFEADPPAFTRLPEVRWVTTRVARLAWTTDEPTRQRVEYSSAGRSGSVEDEQYSRVHTVVLNDLVPSPAVDPLDPTGPTPAPVVYAVDVTAIDHSGNETTRSVAGGLTTRPRLRDRVFTPAGPGLPLVEDLESEQSLVIDDVDWIQTDDTSVAGTLRAGLRVHVRFKDGQAPEPDAAGRALVASVLVRRAGELVPETSSDATPLGIATFRFDSLRATRTGVPQRPELNGSSGGPYLVSKETVVDGATELWFQQPGLLPGDQVIVTIESAVTVDPAELATFHDALAQGGSLLEVPVVVPRYAWRRWSFPDSSVTRVAHCFQASGCDG